MYSDDHTTNTYREAAVLSHLKAYGWRGAALRHIASDGIYGSDGLELHAIAIGAALISLKKQGKVRVTGAKRNWAAV